LNLVEVDGHLFVGVDFFSYKIRDYLFVGRAYTGLAVVTIFESKEFAAIMLPSAALLPQFSRLNSGHKDLYCTGPVHLFPDNVFHFSYGPEAERKIGVNP